MLFEMGIPVVETGDRFHVDVQQKVPLNTDRDNVTPAYLRALRVEVFNATHGRLTEEDATQTWVKEACSDERVENVAVRQAVKLRFGDNAVIYDPSDPEANKLAVAEGRPVIYGGNLSADEWLMVKRADAMRPAGVVTPSPKPYGLNGRSPNAIDVSEWTPGMVRVVDLAKTIARELLACEISVEIVREFGWPYSATYGKGSLTFNLSKLGHDFFDNGITDDVNDLLIHEFGHHYAGDHLSSDYFNALTKLGAKMVRLALDKPEIFR